MKTWTVALSALLSALTLAFIPAGAMSPAHAQEDACGNDALDVPDSGATFDFTEACLEHDECYAAGGTEADRNACDAAFLADMQASCAEMWPDSFFKRRICEGVAQTYHLGVHFFGWLFFPYTA